MLMSHHHHNRHRCNKIPAQKIHSCVHFVVWKLWHTLKHWTLGCTSKTKISEPTIHQVSAWGLVWRAPKAFFISTKFRGFSSHFRVDHFYIVDLHSALTTQASYIFTGHCCHNTCLKSIIIIYCLSHFPRNFSWILQLLWNWVYGASLNAMELTELIPEYY